MNASSATGSTPPVTRAAPFAYRAARRLAISVVVTLLVWLLCWTISGLVHGETGWSRPLDGLVTACLAGLAVLGYVGWPSRWNIPAHMQLAFAITAYVIPASFGTIVSSAVPSVASFYAIVIVVGLGASLVGAAVGAELRVPSWARLEGHARPHSDHKVARRVLIAVAIASVAMFGCFAVMGFVPALVTDDPLNAKFFRGDFAARYAPVAVFYRGAIAVLVVLMPLVTMYALWRRRWYWILALLASVVLMVSTLQRGNAIAGVILFAGVALARLRRRVWSWVFCITLVLVYGFGSASWVLLQTLGIGSFAAPETDTTNIAAVLAAGAPDITDQLSFLGAWLNHPEFTFGRTFYGGLLPYHYEWNPAVWTLMIQQPTTPLDAIASGGLRLPAPLWGYVSFGWPGVVIVCGLAGVVIGAAGAAVRGVVSVGDRERAVIAVVLYAAVLDVLGQFYVLSYTEVFQLLLLLAVVGTWGVRRRRHRRGSRSSTPRRTPTLLPLRAELPRSRRLEGTQ